MQFLSSHTLVEWRTVQTLIWLLLQEQSDLSLHYLHKKFVRHFSVQKFKNFTISYGNSTKLSHQGNLNEYKQDMLWLYK